MWTPVPAETSEFLARRFSHETVIHRADGTLPLGAEFTVDEEIAIDAFDEWMELDSLPQHFEIHPEKLELLGPGRTLHFHATDTPPEAAAEWLIDLPAMPSSGAARMRRPPSLCAARGLTCCWSSTAGTRSQREHRGPRRCAAARLLAGVGRL